MAAVFPLFFCLVVQDVVGFLFVCSMVFIWYEWSAKHDTNVGLERLADIEKEGLFAFSVDVYFFPFVCFLKALFY